MAFFISISGIVHEKDQLNFGSKTSSAKMKTTGSLNLSESYKKSLDGTIRKISKELSLSENTHQMGKLPRYFDT